jgi:uncharacterized OB-fold protein
MQDRFGNEGTPFREGWFIGADEADGPALLATRCGQCAGFYFPPRRLCPNCFSDRELTTVPIGRRGRLHSYTHVLAVPTDFPSPYFIGLVDLPEGVRVTAQLVDVDRDRLHLDMELLLVIDPLKQSEHGKRILTYKYRPCLQECRP